MTGLSLRQSNELSDKDTYSLFRHVAYAPQLDSAVRIALPGLRSCVDVLRTQTGAIQRCLAQTLQLRPAGTVHGLSMEDVANLFAAVEVPSPWMTERSSRWS